MSRSNFKGPFFLNKINKYLKSKEIIIMPENVNKFYFIYNGKKFIKIKITEEMIGYKFGEFILTRARYKYKKQLKKNGNKKS